MNYFNVEQEKQQAEAQLEELRMKIQQSAPGSEAWRAYRQAHRYWEAKLENLIPAMEKINQLLGE